MKKFLYLVFVLITVWLFKMSYDIYTSSSKIQLLQETVHKVEKENANLNDQLVAMQRQTVKVTSDNDSHEKKINNDRDVVSEIQPTIFLKQQLELIQFAIQQQQFTFAFDKLNGLDRSVNELQLADTLKASLHQSISQDKSSLQRFLNERQLQESQLKAMLTQIDLNLLQHRSNDQLEFAPSHKSYFWEKWFKVDQIAEQSPEIANRRMILKEAQLRVLLAQQALSKGDQLEYQKILDQLMTELNALPDRDISNIKKQVEHLKQIKPIVPPKLNSLEILG